MSTPVLHIPVMLNEIINAAKSQSPLRIFDGTFGRGGHSKAFLENFTQSKVVATDLDQSAHDFAAVEFENELKSGKLTLHRANFNEFDKDKFGTFDFMLLDLGVSSPQLDEPERGFSFYNDGPLDMRMNQSQEVTAEYLLQTLTEDELIKVFKEYGEVYSPFRVVRAIVHDRKTKPFTSTLQLAGLIERVDGWRIKGHHPATRYFMALRLAVNAELDSITEAIPKLIAGLNDQGILAIITFHSLEDRIVKQTFKKHLNEGMLINKKVIEASEEEIKMNPRSRSAKLRMFRKTNLDKFEQRRTFE